MRAVQFDAYGGPEMLHLRDVAPHTPNAGEVLIDVYAASVNPIDWKIRAGLVAGNFPLTFPAVSGRDGAGIVRAVGDGVDANLIGKRVAFFAARGQGTWAEELVLPAANIAIVPDSVALTDAAAVPLAGTSAWIPLVDIANVSPGMRVLIHAGAGGVGSLAVQIAKARGAEVIATCSYRNAAFVNECGAQEVIAYDRVPFEDAVRDVDVVFDVMGGDVHRRSYQCLKRRGLMVCLNAEPFVDEGAEHGVTVKVAPILPKAEILDALLKMMDKRQLRVFIEHLLPLPQFRRAHELSQSGHVRGKIVMEIRKPDGSLVA
jgi:NADPH:quinone reductase-like Zn-dependent oxidoreductase